MIGEIFGFLGTVFKWTIISISSTSVIVGISSYQTKPDEKSFDKFFKDYVKANVHGDGLGKSPGDISRTCCSFWDHKVHQCQLRCDVS